MPFNPEASCKDLDNRLKAAERNIGELQKQLRGADFKSLEDRIFKVETLVNIFKQRGTPRDEVIAKTLDTLGAIDYADKKFVDKIVAEYGKESKAERERQEKANEAEWAAEKKKMMDEAREAAKAEQAKALAEAMKALEARLAKLEALVAARK